MKNKKKIILGSILGIFIGLIISTTYAIFSYTRSSANQQLIAGDIYMHYNETNTLTIENALPSNTYDPTKYFEFTIKGKNTNTKYNIVYDINLNYGDEIENKTRIEDRFLKFRLVEVVNNEEQELLTDKTYLSIDNKRIYVSTIPKETNSEITKTYRLYMWIDKSVVIGNTDYSDYSMTDWNNVYGSVKVSVTGDFSEKSIQTEPYLVMKNLGLSGGTDWTNIRANITSIEFHKDGIAPENPVHTIDVTDASSAGEVTLYTVDDGLGNNTYKAIIVGDDVIYAPENSMGLFARMTNLISFNSKNFNVDNVTNMQAMFGACSNLENINSLVNWNTSNVTNMHQMFRDCTTLNNVDGLKKWNVENVQYMGQMFFNCVNLEKIDLSNWKTSSLTAISNMFSMFNTDGSDCLDAKLKKIILSNNFDTSNVTSMYGLFSNNTKIEDYSFLQYLDTRSVKQMTQMFYNNWSLTDLQYVSNWDVSSATDMSNMFSSCSGLTNVNGLSNWNVSNVTNMGAMFSDVNIISYQPFSNWDVSKVQYFSDMFNQNNDSTVTSLAGLENWDVSSATDMSKMFWDNWSLVDASAINNWNINASINFTEMFGHNDLLVHPTFSKVQGTWDENGTFTPNV